MSRRRKANSRRPGPTKPYTGPILRSDITMTMDDGTEYEFTIPKNGVSVDKWRELIAEGWQVDERR